MCEQAVERTPAVQNMSFTASGIPSSGPALPCAIRVSEALAMSVARSGVSSTNALSARAFSIEAWCAAVNSVAEKDFFFRPSRASARVSEVSSLTVYLIRVSGRVGRQLAQRRAGRLAQETGFAGKSIPVPEPAPLRLESVKHGPVTEFTGGAHPLNLPCFVVRDP